MERYIYFKELAHMTGEAGRSKICRVGHQGEDRIPSSVFVLLRPSTDQMRPTYIMEGNFTYLVATDLNVNLI